jgi:hypothetical protein
VTERVRMLRKAAVVIERRVDELVKAVCIRLSDPGPGVGGAHLADRGHRG